MSDFRRSRIISENSDSDSASIFGLLGHNIGYSLSPAMHNHYFASKGMNAVYGLFDIDPDDFDSNARTLISCATGLNVTVPYKERIIPLLDSLKDEALKTGSVNLVFGREGYNTDYMALRKLVGELDTDFSGKECTVFGAGGAARTASFLFGELGMNITIANRTMERASKLVHDLGQSGIEAGFEQFPPDPVNAISKPFCAVNCISSGEAVFPHIEAEYVVDFNYGKRSNAFRNSLKDPKILISGEKILIEQAIYSQKIWNNVSPSFMEMAEVLDVK